MQCETPPQAGHVPDRLNRQLHKVAAFRFDSATTITRNFQDTAPGKNATPMLAQAEEGMPPPRRRVLPGTRKRSDDVAMPNRSLVSVATSSRPQQASCRPQRFGDTCVAKLFEQRDLVRWFCLDVRLQAAERNRIHYIRVRVSDSFPTARRAHSGEIRPIYDRLGTDRQTGSQEIVTNWPH